MSWPHIATTYIVWSKVTNKVQGIWQWPLPYKSANQFWLVAFCLTNNFQKMPFTWLAKSKVPLHGIIHLNLCHPWMKRTTYDLQRTILRIEFKHDLNKKIVHGMEPQKTTNPILLQTSLDPLALYSSNANISS